VVGGIKKLKVPHHIGLSLSISLGVYTLFHSAAMAIASFFSGILVDLDHIFEYLREYGLRLDARFFFHSFHNTLYRKVVLFLHAWEWLAVLAVCAVLLHGNVFVIGIMIGIAQHLIADQYTNPVSRWGYFFIYRLRCGFVTSRIFPGKGLE
jgi:hypothetical protein